MSIYNAKLCKTNHNCAPTLSTPASSPLYHSDQTVAQRKLLNVDQKLVRRSKRVTTIHFFGRCSGIFNFFVDEFMIKSCHDQVMSLV